MKRKVFLFILFEMSLFWTGSAIFIGFLLPWSWARVAVIAYALCLTMVSFVRYRRYQIGRWQTPVMAKNVEGKEFFRITNILLSYTFFFLSAFLPRPWTSGNVIIICLFGGSWIVFLCRDICSNRKKRPPTLREMGGPLPLIRASKN